MNEISTKDFLDLSKMLPELRFEYALTQMIEKQNLWGLYGESGWVMLKADDDACIPIWPHKELLVFPLGDDEEGIMLEAEEMISCIEEDLKKLVATDPS
jgi:hypothetical protein